MADVVGKRISELANNASIDGTAIFPHTQNGSTMRVSLSNLINYILAQVDEDTVKAAVNEWMTNHPDVTTTVQDGAISTVKLANDAVTSEKIKNGTIAGIDLSMDLLNAICASGSASGSVATFHDGAYGLPLKSCIVSVNPVQSGSGDPSPTNIRPITGWNGVQVWDDPMHGGNVEWNQTMRDITNNSNFGGAGGSIQYSNGRIVFVPTTGSAPRNFGQKEGVSAVSVTGHKYYYYSVVNRKVAKNNFVVAPRIGQYITITNVNANTDTVIEGIFTASGDSALRFYFYPYGTNSVDLTDQDVCSILHPMICDLTAMFGVGNEPATVEEFRSLFPADYYQYNAGEITTVSAVNGNPYIHRPITFPTEAGTVYGGTLDVVNGKLTVDRAMVDLGTLSWFYNSTNLYFSAYIADMENKYNYASNITDIIMSIAKYKGAGVSWTNMENGNFGVNAQEIRLKLTDYTSSAALIAAITGQQLVYPLATTLEYDIDPTTVTTLLGQNNVWADCGDISVDYFANTQAYIEQRINATKSIITGVEAGFVATQNYASGSLLIVGDTLYLTSAAIANGAAIVPGTNCTPTTVADNLGGSGT